MAFDYTVIDADTLAATGGEDTVASETNGPAVYVAVADLSAMGSGDEVVLRFYAHVGSTERLVAVQSYEGAQVEPRKESEPFAVSDGARYTIEWAEGTADDVPWEFLGITGGA